MIVFETFVGFWACLVALGRIWKVSWGFLGCFFTFLCVFIIFSMILWAWVGGVGRVGRMGRVGGWGGWALRMVGRALHMLCKVSLLLLLASTFA